MFSLQLPLTCKPWTTLSNLTNKVRGKYFYKEVFLRLSLSLRLSACVVYHCVVCQLRASVIHCVSMYPVYICIFLHESDDNVTGVPVWFLICIRAHFFQTACKRLSYDAMSSDKKISAHTTQLGMWVAMPMQNNSSVYWREVWENISVWRKRRIFH